MRQIIDATHGIVKNRKSRTKAFNFIFHDSMSAIGFINGLGVIMDSLLLAPFPAYISTVRD